MNLLAEEKDNFKLKLNRSPKYANIMEGYTIILNLSDLSQKLLGCAVNKDVFMECPYAFVPRKTLLKVLQTQEKTAEDVLTQIAASSLNILLIGYIEEKIKADVCAGKIIFFVFFFC